MLGIIGGSGLTELANLEAPRREAARTPYGEPSGALVHGLLRGRPVVFLPRHGYGHTIAPHEVNYRANLWALREQGVERIVAVASVGGIRDDLVPGTLALPEQIIDYTYGRRMTFYEGASEPVRHVDFTHPYCESLRTALGAAAQRAGDPLVTGGVYAATQGPRLETAAEIERLARDGADMVGMTGMPEAGLARELDLCYAVIAVVANYAAGRGTSDRGIALHEINGVLQPAMGRVRRILEALAEMTG